MALKRQKSAETITTDNLSSFKAAMKELGGRLATNNSAPVSLQWNIDDFAVRSGSPQLLLELSPYFRRLTFYQGY
jgi:hypothetical protein